MEANNATAINFELLAERRAKEAAQDKLDAQRYRKLKTEALDGNWISTEHWDWSTHPDWDNHKLDFDAAVDALPEPK